MAFQSHASMTMVLFFGALAACGGTAAPAPAQTPAPVAAKSGLVAASPNVGVSKEIAEECKLALGSTEKAPKFAFDQSTLLPEDQAVLERVATCVTTGALKGRALRLVGHTDKRGETEYNLALGDRRADSARSFLAKRGVDPKKLAETSRGELDASGTDEASMASDRRVDIVLQ